MSSDEIRLFFVCSRRTIKHLFYNLNGNQKKIREMNKLNMYFYLKDTLGFLFLFMLMYLAGAPTGVDVWFVR